MLGLQFGFLDEFGFEKEIFFYCALYLYNSPRSLKKCSFCDISKVSSTPTFFKKKNSKALIGPEVLSNTTTVGTQG